MKFIFILFIISYTNIYAANFDDIKKLLDETATNFKQNSQFNETLLNATQRKLKIQLTNMENDLAVENQKLLDIRLTIQDIGLNPFEQTKSKDQSIADQEKVVAEKIKKVEALRKKTSDIRQHFLDVYKAYRGFDNQLLSGFEKKLIPPEIIELFENDIQQVFDTITKGEADSYFLVTDLDQLQNKLEFDELSLFALKHNAYKNLNNTLVGDYINGQIKKTMGNYCEISKSCSVVPEEAVQNQKIVEKVLEQLFQSSSETEIKINGSNRSFTTKEKGIDKQFQIDENEKVIQQK
ncbi:MAG: hypothetical protein H6622_04530 [Halobacteriovoraceae bacterium]|nr:hypothetical protein [Halobacteriovoraceae bacterium]